jgi:branched-chain amino acid aminotransferase
MKTYCFAKDRIRESKTATIHPMDIGLIRGYGIFDFFRTAHYVPLFLQDYLDRFIRSAEKMHLPLPLDRAGLEDVILELVSKNELENGGIRMLLTGGISDNHFSPNTGSLFIFCEALDFPPMSKYETGVKLVSAEHVRAVADIKTTNYAFPVWHSANWKKEGAEDLIYHQNGFISESSRSNIFIIKDGKIATPDQNVLHGITRMRTLELAPETEIRPITFEELLNADEVFMTSTTKKILPVTKIDNHAIGEGKPGKKTMALLKDFLEMEKKIVGAMSENK